MGSTANGPSPRRGELSVSRLDANCGRGVWALHPHPAAPTLAPKHARRDPFSGDSGIVSLAL